MRIVVIGAGAVGGYFGARLAAAGRDVTFLVRAGRAEQLRAHGLRIAGARGELRVAPQMLTAVDLCAQPGVYDLILLSTKAYSLAAALEDFAPAVGAETAILPLLNGMRHLDALVARFGGAAVLGGLTRIVADLDAKDTITVFEPLHDLTFGERDRSVTPRIEAIHATLSGCGFDAQLVPDILASMWMKWVLLSGIGAVTLLGRGTIGEINRAPGGTDLARAVVAESLAIAAANGYPQPPEVLAMIDARLTNTGSVLVSSMYRDLHKGAPVEADHILGDLLARGAAHGVRTPLLNAAYVQLKVYERRRA